MDFFMSAETDSRHDSFGDEFRRIRKEINDALKDFLRDKSYGNEIQDLSVIPIIIKFDEQMEKEGWFKEKITFKKVLNQGDVRLRIDYDKFVKGDDNTKKLLLIDNVIKSIRALSQKAKNDFDAKQLEDNILKLFNLTITDLENL